MKRTTQTLICVILIFAVSFLLLNRNVSADSTGEGSPPVGPFLYFGKLTVHIQSPSGDPIANVPVIVEVIDDGSDCKGQVKVDDGKWICGGWSDHAETVTDTYGNATFRLRRLFHLKIHLRITACEQVIDDYYDLSSLCHPANNEEIITCEIGQVIPEAPFLGTFGLGLTLLFGLIFFLTKRREI